MFYMDLNSFCSDSYFMLYPHGQMFYLTEPEIPERVKLFNISSYEDFCKVGRFNCTSYYNLQRK